MFDLALTFLLAALVSAGVAFFGVAGEASELIAALAWVFVSLFVVAIGVVVASRVTRQTAG